MSSSLLRVLQHDCPPQGSVFQLMPIQPKQGYTSSSRSLVPPFLQILWQWEQEAGGEMMMMRLVGVVDSLKW